MLSTLLTEEERISISKLNPGNCLEETRRCINAGVGERPAAVDGHFHLDKMWVRVGVKCLDDLRAMILADTPWFCVQYFITSFCFPATFPTDAQKTLINQDARIRIKYGWHPAVADEMNAEGLKRIRKLTAEGSVAIGEIGLDYLLAADEEQREKQKVVFAQMVDLAMELDLPIVLHCRESKKDNSKPM